MQREITPTSPKYKNQPVAGPGRWPFITLVAAIFLGFLAGFLGSIIRESYSFDQVLPATEKQIVVKEKSTSERAAAISQMIDKIKPSLLAVYADGYQATAAALTSDGWLVASSSLPEEFILINKDYKEYSPEKIIADSWSGLSFIKINAQNLSVAEFAWPEKGEELLAYYYTPDNQQNLAIDYLANNNYYSNLLRTTSAYNRHFLLTQDLAADYYNAPVINLTGQIVGFYQADRRVLPAEIISGLANQIIKNQAIKNVDLSLDYYDLAYSYNLSPEKKGALVFKLGRANGLKLNDIITKVEETNIDEYHDLNYTLQKYYDQETVNLTVLRDEEEIEVEIEL